MGDFAGAGAFEGDGEDALGLRQMPGMLAAEIAKEAMDGTEADIAGADSVVPGAFQALQECGDLFDGKMLDGELAGIAFLSGGELEQ